MYIVNNAEIMAVFSYNKEKVFFLENAVFDLVLSVSRIFVNACFIISTLVLTINCASFNLFKDIAVA